RPRFCELAPSAGSCFGFVSSYYYNRYSNTCHSFTYSGCGKNANRFRTIDECNRTCVV
uniref:Kunitz-type serine protease inhibitor n=1 Tax=Naja naja TaxID=35670 RepID=VKTCI_NAJNA|nr:RecName: Full=Kunitz-type serine protease inhibitor; AltName: Full=Venom chymotrypsin inhibitor [Naja naja]prf//1702215A chymotrypsin inhibitor [Naja naja]